MPFFVFYVERVDGIGYETLFHAVIILIKHHDHLGDRQEVCHGSYAAVHETGTYICKCA
jgi:hypothetical protein